MMGSLTINLDGEQAVQRAREILSRLGRSEELTLQTLDDRHPNSREKQWNLSFSTKRGAVFITLDAHSGQVKNILCPFNPAMVALSNKPPTPAAARRAHFVLRTLGYDKDVRLDSDTGYRNGLGRATFYRTIHSLRFFNINPTYAHTVQFEPDSGSVYIFQPCPPLPSVNSWIPRVTAHTALAKIHEWARRRSKQKSRPLIVTPGELRADLGYWKFKNEAKARLVWRVVHVMQINGLPYGGGSYTIFVDALTGQFVEPDDPSIGANP
jgi:hypothetical protein